jgi:tetratricopeptide (TPR) repeat protein
LYREAVQLAPDDPQAHAGLDLIRAEQGDLLTAEQEFTKALRRWPDYPEALFGVAMLHAWRGQTRENIAGLGRVIEVCPVLWEAYVKLAAAYGKLGLTPQAATAIRYAKEVYPDVAIPEAVKQWDAPSGQ